MKKLKELKKGKRLDQPTFEFTKSVEVDERMC